MITVGIFEAVVDCSVGIGWLFDEQADPYSESALHALTVSFAVALRWWTIEILNVLLALERRERLAAGKAMEALHWYHPRAFFGGDPS